MSKKQYYFIILLIIILTIFFFVNNNAKLIEKMDLKVHNINNAQNTVDPLLKYCELIQQNMIKNSENIEFKVNSLIYETKILINKKKIGYISIFNNYIYYREDFDNVDKLNNQVIKRFKIINKLNIVEDDSYFLNMGIASHNFRFFNFNNNIYGIGGQAFGITNYYDFLNTNNQEYIEYHKELNILIDSYDYNINSLAGDKIYNPNIKCPYYANGLHLFLFDNSNENSFTVENNGLPILSGIVDGRHDGHYGTCDNVSIDNSKNGLTVYDSQTSLLYNNNTFYLYQRANIGTGTRYIQYSTSTDLINWSEFNLLKINPEIKYFEYNFYYSNFFKIAGVNNFIGILQSNKKKSNKYDDLDNIQNYILYYSSDCINWNYIGIIGEDEYYKNWIVVGEPILIDNKYYFYILDYEKFFFKIYYIEKNRFSYITYIQENLISKLEFKLMYFEEKSIKINFKTEDNGYIKIQLKDEHEIILGGFSFDDFDIINENIDEFEFVISWNNNNIIPNNKLYIEVEGINYNIYSINCNSVCS